MFRINPSKTSRNKKHVLNTISASARTKLITVSQTHGITKKDVNSDLNGLSSTGVDNTKTRRLKPRSNTKHDRVPSASKSSQSKNKVAEIEEHHRNLLLSKNNKHISSVCNNSKIDSQEVISKVICTMCKKCLIFVNHDKCLLIYVNGKIPRGGKIVDYSESKSTFDCSNGDNACTSNTVEPKIKRFPNSTSLLGRNDHVVAILGFVDLQWGNILITRVYFVEGLGHNLFRQKLGRRRKKKRASHPPKPVPNSRQRLHFLHMDLCGPIRIASINGKQYVLVIVDDYSRYTWVHFLRAKDGAPEVIIKFLKRITLLL
nr:Gag-Pol polyprotein [Tanacetum cinerariifolium]